MRRRWRRRANTVKRHGRVDKPPKEQPKTRAGMSGDADPKIKAFSGWASLSETKGTFSDHSMLFGCSWVLMQSHS